MYGCRPVPCVCLAVTEIYTFHQFLTFEEKEEVAAAPSHDDAGDVDDLVSALVGAKLISVGGSCTVWVIYLFVCIYTSILCELG